MSSPLNITTRTPVDLSIVSQPAEMTVASPLSEVNNRPPYPYPTINEVDRLLKLLYEHGFIDLNWTWKGENKLEDLVVDDNKNLLDRKVRLNPNVKDDNLDMDTFLKYCVEAAESIDSFSLHGSYAAFFVGVAKLQEILKQFFDSALIDSLQPSFGYSDLDFKIKAKKCSFVDNLAKLTGNIPFVKFNPIFEVDLEGRTVEGEAIKIISDNHEVDVTYYSKAEGEETRAAFQELTIDVLKRPFQIKGTMQSVLDLLCNIGHWTKKNNDFDDLCAYLWMVTNGKRFPNREAIELLLQKKDISLLKKFKKIEKVSGDKKAIYLLNACEVLRPTRAEQQLIFKDVNPESPALNTLCRLLESRQIDYASARAALSFVAYRTLLIETDNPYRIELTSHEGALVYQFNFAGAYFFISTDMISTMTPGFIELLNAFGCLNPVFTFNRASPIKEMISPISMNHPVLDHFLLQARIFFSRDFKAVVLMLQRDFEQTVTTKKVLLSAADGLIKKDRTHYLEAIENFFAEGVSKQHVYQELLYIDDKTLFDFGISVMNAYPYYFPYSEYASIVQQHINRKKIGNALGLLEFLDREGKGTLDQWKHFLNQIVTYMSEAKPVDFNLHQERITRFGKLLLNVLDKLNVELSISLDWEAVKGLFAHISHGPLFVRFEKCSKELEKRREQIAFEHCGQDLLVQQTLEAALKLLAYVSNYPSEVREFFSKWVKTQDKSTFAADLCELLKNDQFRQLFSAPKTKNDFVELLNPVLTEYLKQPQSFSSICLIVCEGLEFSIEFYERFLNCALQTSENPYADAACKVVFANLEKRSLKPIQRAEFILKRLKTTFTLQSEGQQLAELNPELTPKQSQRIFFNFYKILIQMLKKNIPLSECFSDLVRTRNSLHYKMDKTQVKALREYDLFLIQHLALNFEEYNLGFLLKLLREFLSSQSSSNDEINTLKKLIEQTVDPLLDSIFHLFCENIHVNERYVALADHCIGHTHKRSYVMDLTTHLNDLKSTFKDSKVRLLPASLFREILGYFGSSISEVEFKVIGRLLSQSYLQEFLDRNTYLNLLRQYFNMTFKLMFESDPTYYQAAEDLLIAAMTTQLSHYRDKTVSPPRSLDKNHSEYLDMLKQRNLLPANGKGVLFAMLCSIHALWINFYNVVDTSADDLRNSWDDLEKILHEYSKKNISFDLIDLQFENIPEDILFLMIRAALSIKPQSMALESLLCIFLFRLLSEVKKTNCEEYFDLFDQFVYLKQRSINALGLELHYTASLELFHQHINKKYDKCLPKHKGTTKKIEYGAIFATAEPIVFDSGEVDRILFETLDKFKRLHVNLNASIAVNLFKTISINLNSNRYLEFIKEIKAAVAQCDAYTTRHDVYTAYLTGLIDTAKKLVLDAREGLVELGNYEEKHFIQAIHVTCEEVIQHFPKDSHYLFMIKCRLLGLIKIQKQAIDGIPGLRLELIDVIVLEAFLLNEIHPKRLAFIENFENAPNPSKQFEYCSLYFEKLKKQTFSIDEAGLTSQFKLILLENWGDLFIKTIDAITKIGFVENPLSVGLAIKIVSTVHSRGPYKEFPSVYSATLTHLLPYLPPFLTHASQFLTLNDELMHSLIYCFLMAPPKLTDELTDREFNEKKEHFMNLFKERANQFLMTVQRYHPLFHKSIVNLLKQKHRNVIASLDLTL